MAKIMIWPDLYKEQGHWLPCVNLANTLTAPGQDHDVSFIGIPDCEPIIKRYGGKFYTILEDIYPLGHTLENKLEPLDQRWKPAHLMPICRGDLKHIFEKGSELRPDLLIVGYFAGLEAAIIAHKYGVKIMVITTYLRHPDEDPAMHAATKLLYLPDAVAEKIITSSAGAMEIEQFVKPLEDTEEMIPCAREFDYYDDDWQHAKNVTYVEPMIERHPLGPDAVDDSPEVVVPEGKKLIFATSGSMVEDYLSKAQTYFETLIGMMKTRGMDQYHLVLGTGDKLKLKLEKKYKVGKKDCLLPSNVSIYSWVSQLDILKRAEVVYMHGGLATIKESIWEQVPIVIVPHGKDQMDNAARIRETGVGVISEASELNPAQLRTLLTEATTSNWIRKRLKKMRDIFAGDEDASNKTSVAVIDSVMNPPA